MTFPSSVTPDLPDELARDWFGLGTWAIIAVSVVVAVIGWRKLSRGIEATNKQVVNGHGDADPLRRDLDNKFERVFTVLGELKGAMSSESAERRAEVEAIHQELRDIRRVGIHHDGE